MLVRIILSFGALVRAYHIAHDDVVERIGSRVLLPWPGTFYIRLARSFEIPGYLAIPWPSALLGLAHDFKCTWYNQNPLMPVIVERRFCRLKIRLL